VQQLATAVSEGLANHAPVATEALAALGYTDTLAA
jgi:hypothetical protein